jgi:hypothetical protein
MAAKMKIDVPDYVFKMIESIIGMQPGEAVRMKLNNARFSLFRTCYLTPDLDKASKMFVNSFIIQGLDWISIRFYYQSSILLPRDGINDLKTPLELLPSDVRKKYEARIEDLYTVVPYYVIRHEGSVEESKDSTKFNTALHSHFRQNRVLKEASSWYHDSQTKMLDLIFNRLDKMQIVVNGELHATVCKFCQNYFRAVSGMCHFRKSPEDRTGDKTQPGRLLCGMKLLYKSDMDDTPPEVEAPYEVNLLKELSTVSET